ncbi:MetQ/NlpA family ABC transporter substrate-binding protein [Candidatus Phytoplasma sacchari]|uniref:MetQ/NlpA family ABC transporter substrate-binding protein n=1 Tax=Candidatus Phytoplasma sacchari TaxID=2609813 RepID=A0ABY7M3I0_9MOLU|nr:MetQ/NlpA family ABC transporter substrate-binding protein [Candidatus Phytoplasma sacchari]
MFFQKNKKIIIILSIFTFLLAIVFYFVNPFKEKNNKKDKTIKIATALESTRDFLEGDFKNEFKNKNIDLKVSFLYDQFAKTNELLLKDKVSAILDSHLPFAVNKDKSKNKSDGQKLFVVRPFYLPKIGLYSCPKRNTTQKIKNVNDIKQIGLNSLQNQTPIVFKILLSEDIEQESFFLLFLEKIGLIQMKDNIDKKKIKLFDTTHFTIPSYIKIITEPNLTPLYNKFMNEDDIHFFVNYPGILGKNQFNLNVIESLPVPSDLNDPIYDYTISLITKKDNIISEKFKIFMDTLSQPKWIDILNKKYNGYLHMIPMDQVEHISLNVNERFKY